MQGNVVTIGTFDGVHLGHRAILDRVTREARERDIARLAYVFEHPPRVALEAEGAGRLLLPLDVRLRLLHACVDRVVLARFPDVRRLSPGDFAERVISRELKARCVVVGSSFRYGRDRRGDIATLRSSGDALGYDVFGVDPVEVDGQTVSSTRVRELLEQGAPSQATRLLGRPPILVGPVVRGDGIVRALGYPAADVALDPDILLPADGVYLCHVYAGDARDHGLLYVGTRPTLTGRDRKSEVHLLSSPVAGLDGLRIEVHILERLRADRPFSSVDALRRQIGEDVRHAETLRGRYPIGGDPLAS